MRSAPSQIIMKILLCVDWTTFLPYELGRSFSKINPRSSSNHWLILVNSSPRIGGPSLFRFENMWILHLTFKELIDVWWEEENTSCSAGFRFINKLQYIKSKLRVRNRNMFG